MSRIFLTLAIIGFIANMGAWISLHSWLWAWFMMVSVLSYLGCFLMMFRSRL